LIILLTVLSALAIVTARDALVLKKAISVALGSGTPSIPTLSDLPLPALPTTNTLNRPFARFAAELVARLENTKTQGLAVPSTLTSLGTFNSNAGKFNGWLLRATPSTMWLVFRGTSTRDEWEKDFELKQVSFIARMGNRSISRIAYSKYLMQSPMATATPLFAPEVGVHSGFMDIYTSLRPLMLAVLQNSNFTQLCITGHSMGAAQALCATLDLATLFPAVKIDTVVFGCPRVGNTAFAAAVVAPTNVNSLVIVANTCDMVTAVPLAVQPTLTPPYTPLVYTHPAGAVHNFTDNREGWISNHMIGLYIDYLS